MRIISIARLVRTKRIDQLIKAVARLKIKVDLTIIGTGPQEPALKNLAGGQVKFLKNLTRRELIARIKQADIFCLPSVVEGFGIVTIEAMAAGLPAVLADIPVNREITHDGQGALFFRPEDVDDLRSQLKKLITDKKFYRLKQAEALQLARTYTWEKIYRQTKAVYETCFHH